MLGIDANDAHDAFAFDDLALVADFFDTGPNFHGLLLENEFWTDAYRRSYRIELQRVRSEST